MLPEHHNRLYTEEAISSISLARDVADKINELVEAYNQFSTDDLAWKQEQDGRVRKAVLYMKDNLLNSLNDLMVLLRDSGFIDDRIEYHCQNLRERVDNLLNANVSDGELLDVRIGNEGERYENAGESVRQQIQKLYEMIVESSLTTRLLPGELEVGYIDSTGSNYDSIYCLRTKGYYEPKANECTLINTNPDQCVIRVFRYNQDGTFEKEYQNANRYILDIGKKYKFSFAFNPVREMTTSDIGRFNLLHYKEMPEISPEMFGAKANDETFDNGSAFYLMVEYLKSIAPLVDFEGRPVYDFKGITFKFNGTYSIKGGVTFPDMLNGVFKGLRLKQIGEEDTYLLNLGYSRDCRFKDMLLDGNYISSCILLRDGYSNLSIKDSVICHFTYYGIRTSGHGGHELNIVGNKIFQTEYQNFDTMKKTNSIGCAILLTDGHTDNLISDNIICYTFGEKQIQISSGSLMFQNNHLYNAGYGEIYIHGTNHVYTGNFFDCITVNDARGGNLFTGNTFMSTQEYRCMLMRFTTANFFGRKTMVNNNMLKAPTGYLYEGVTTDCLIEGNLETEV